MLVPTQQHKVMARRVRFPGENQRFSVFFPIDRARTMTLVGLPDSRGELSRCRIGQTLGQGDRVRSSVTARQARHRQRGKDHVYCLEQTWRG